MDKQILSMLEELWRRWDFLLASFLVLISFFFWSVARHSGLIRAIRWGISACGRE